MNELVNLEREWEVTKNPKDANQTKQNRETYSNNVKEIKWWWCKGKQFLWSNSTWAYFLEIWLGILSFFDGGYGLNMESSFIEEVEVLVIW